jgi:hypothetical protein
MSTLLNSRNSTKVNTPMSTEDVFGGAGAWYWFLLLSLATPLQHAQRGPFPENLWLTAG